MGALEGKVAIVTGGASGIGEATCYALAKEGVKLVVVDMDQERINKVERECQRMIPGEGVSILGLALDVRQERAMEEMARRAIAHFERIDLLVHSAGILRSKGSGPKFLYEVSLDEWDTVIATNLKGTFLSNRAVIPTMIQQRNGHIINLSSTSGLKGRAYDSVYCASKFGVIGLSEALAEEVRQYGIKVHVVMPDAVNTPIWNQNGPVRAPKDSLAPERVANVITYLASLPVDTLLNNLVILPFKTRRRKTSEKAEN
jgi:3-oxoacyl-[acyl-carrier protein] reductase